MNLAPRCDFVVGLREDILACVRSSYGESGPSWRKPTSAASSTDLGTGDEDEMEGEQQTPEAEIDETDSGIVKLCNQIIIDAYNRGASDIHVEPYGKTAPTQVRLRVDGDCSKYLDIPRPHRNAVVQRPEDHGALDISEKRKPQDGKIRFRGPMGRSSCASPPSPRPEATRTW
jgi:type II secretory ATPase GspE/PulE/Tfp pilus assembly ATPase PilB-like protein